MGKSKSQVDLNHDWIADDDSIRQTPSEGCGTAKIKLEIVTTLTYKPSLVRINAGNFELSW